MKTPGLHSPFIDGEVLGAAPSLRSPFEQVMAEPKAPPMPASAAAGVRVIDAAGDPLSGVAWSLHQGALELRGTLVAGEADVLLQGAKSFDRSKPFRFHVEGHVCSIVSGAVLLVDEPGVEYGGSLFDWHDADSADAALRSRFWKDYAARRQQDTAPSVFRFIQHDHIMRRPVRWLKGTNLAVFQAQPLAIRLGPLVRYTDHRQARIWLELNAPGLVRVHYGAAPDAKKKPTGDTVPANLRTRHTCSVRVGGRHYAMLTLDELPADSVVMYTLELAPQPPTGPLPRTEIDFTEARFPRELPKASLQPQQAALAQISLMHRHWLYLRTLPQSGEALRFAHGSCRVHPDDNDDGQQQGEDMLARFGNDFLAQQELAAWPQFFMHTGDQIYADDIGERLGKQIVRQRHSATFPGPRQGHALALGAWAGRFAPRFALRTTVLPAPPEGDVDAIDQQRNTARDPERVAAAVGDARDALKQAPFQMRAMLPEGEPPKAQKLQVMNQLLWQPPIAPADVPLVDKRRGLLQAPTFRILRPQQRDVRLPYPAAGDIGGVHVADYAEYAAAYEQAWLVHGARRGMAHLPNYMIFDDHEVTDDWNADTDWLACIHHKRDTLGMWPATMTDALASYWLYQGWGNLEPAVAAADPRVQILERARHQGHDALPELRQLIHTRAIAPTDKLAKPAARANLLAWNFRVPTSGTPFVVLDLRTDREIHGKGGMSKGRLDWLRTVLGAARTRSAFVVLPVPLLMPAPLAFAMQHPGVVKIATGVRSKAEARRKSDLEHPIMNLVWEQFRELLRELQKAGSPLRTLAIVSGDIHFSCNLDGQLPGSTQGPRMLQLISSGLRKVIGPKKEGFLFDAYRDWLSVITRSQGVDERRGVRATIGGLEGPTPVLPGQGLPGNPKQGELKNFVFPTSVALVHVVPTRDQPAARVLGDTALIKQWHLVAAASGKLAAWSFNHATRAEGGWMTLNDPGLAYADRPDTYPRDSRPMGLVREVLDQLESADDQAEAGDFQPVHETLHGEVEPTLEVIDEAEPESSADEAESGFEFGAEGEDLADDQLAPSDDEEPHTEAEVIGDDSRKVVADTLDVPHRWICALDIYYDTGPLGRNARYVPDHARGTGVLIGPRHVLTAAHVLGPVPVKFDGVDYQLPVTRIVVAPARDGRNDKAPLGQSKRVWWGRPQAREINRPGPHGTVIRARLQDDYALLVVKDNLAAASHPRFKRLGYWGEDPRVSELRPVGDAELSGTVTVAGYPGDTSDRTILPREQGADADAQLKQSIEVTRRNKGSTWAARMWESSGSLRRDVVNQRVLHDADTYQGNSGGPVFAQRDGVWCLLAVHGGAGSQDAQTHQVADNRAAPVTSQMLSQLNDWMNQQGGRGTSSLVGGRLVLAAAAAPAREMEDAQAEDEGAVAEEGLADNDFELEVGSLAFEDEAASPAGAAALVTKGLGLAEAWLRRQPRSGVPELLRFAVSLLRTHFFPRGHGVIDAAGQVQKQAPVAQIAMRLRLRDGSPAPFEHRVRLWISARGADSAVVAGRHSDALFSSITLYAPAFAGAAATVAVQHAVHEVLHMLFTLVDRLRQRHGDAMADAFLQKDPWKLLDLRRYATWRDRLQQGLSPLMHLLGSPEPAADAANRLVEETFAATLAMHLRFTLERGAKSGIVSSSMTETLVRHYVLDHSPRLSSLLGSAELAQASEPLKPIFDELQAAMNATWQGGTAAPAPQPEALFEPF